jgi:nucleoid-associated protein YgaU
MVRLLRCGLVLIGTATATTGLGAWLLPVARKAGGGFDDRLTSACAAGGLLAGAWLWLVTVVVVVEALQVGDRRAPGDRARLAPAAVRRAVLAACGMATVASLTAPVATATPGGPRPGPTVGSVVARALRDIGRAGHAVGRDSASTGRDRIVVVARGDCLWDIAARDLADAETPGTAAVGDADVGRRWREVYAANRAEIGPDPDLVRPGQRLRLPR